jgi:hypothetical protein
VVPALSLPDGMLTGVTALAHLADLAAKAPQGWAAGRRPLVTAQPDRAGQRLAGS